MPILRKTDERFLLILMSKGAAMFKGIYNSWLFQIALMFGVIYLMGQAAEFGQIWDSVANPRENVEVGLGEKTYKGTLSRNWDKSWVLVLDSGERIIFTKFSWMATQMEVGDKDESLLFPSFWRALLPPFLVVAAMMLLWLLPGFKRIWGATQNNAHDSSRE